jgi:hypothetical protein
LALIFKIQKYVVTSENLAKGFVFSQGLGYGKKLSPKIFNEVVEVNASVITYT